MTIPKNSAGRPRKYDFSKLVQFEDGIAFSVKSRKEAIRISNAARAYGRGNGFKVIIRNIDNTIHVYRGMDIGKHVDTTPKA